MNVKTIQEISFAVGLLGALVIVYGAGLMIIAGRSYAGPDPAQHQHEKMAYLIGGLLVAAAFAGLLVATLEK